jgi:hypothetical protein
MAWPTYSEMKEKGGIWSCPKCEGTDKWCILEMVPNAKFSGERSESA